LTLIVNYTYKSIELFSGYTSAVGNRLKTKRVQFFDSILEQNQNHTITFGLTADSPKPIAKQLQINKVSDGKDSIWVLGCTPDKVAYLVTNNEYKRVDTLRFSKGYGRCTLNTTESTMNGKSHKLFGSGVPIFELK
jgi:hypothetical protein